MNAEDLLHQAREALNSDPELAHRNQQMRALLDHAQSIAEIVNAYKVGCMHPAAPPRQIEETEQAMFCACHMLLQMFLRKAGEGNDGGQHWVESVMRECTDYAAARFTRLTSH